MYKKSKKCNLIIDYSYGNMQVYLLDPKGKVLSSAQQAISIRSSQLGWQDYDPLDITYSISLPSPQSTNPIYKVFGIKSSSFFGTNNCSSNGSLI